MDASDAADGRHGGVLSEKDVPGESLFIYLKNNGDLGELLIDGTSHPLELHVINVSIVELLVMIGTRNKCAPNEAVS